MKSLIETVKNSKGVIMVMSIVILMAVAAVGIAMVTSAAMSSTIAKNYKYRIQSFYAADGQMTVLSQAVIDSQMSRWTGGGGARCTLLTISSVTSNSPGTDLNPASNAIDKNTGTRWETIHGTNGTNNQQNPPDPSWIYIDLGSSKFFTAVVLDWQNASAQDYSIDGSDDAATWTTGLATRVNMPQYDHRIDSITGLSATYRYIRMYGTRRTSQYGYSMYEFKVYSTAPDTTKIGGFNVVWSIARNGDNPNNYTIQLKSLQQNSKWGTIFETPLTQDIDRQYGGGFTSPGAAANVAVTYYDYHSDRTNPEFEQPCLNATQRNMVADNLDSERKPTVGSGACLNYCIAKWFRPWTPGDTTIPVYHQTVLRYTTVDSTGTHTLVRWKRTGAWRGGEWGNASASEVNGVSDDINPKIEKIYRPAGDPINDTAFKNVVIHDSLSFHLINATTATYQFDKSGFWPLDNRGFGNEWVAAYQDSGITTPTPDTAITHLAPGVWPHNFAFTMEIKRTFVKTPHDTFAFVGDDDIWLFLNNKLVMDLGGPHAGGSMRVLIDTCFKNTGNPADTLVTYKTYNFDFFYCERHSSNSNCKITTNILYYFPAQSQRRSWQRSYGTLD